MLLQTVRDAIVTTKDLHNELPEHHKTVLLRRAWGIIEFNFQALPMEKREAWEVR